jgi:hypothetical protein
VQQYIFRFTIPNKYHPDEFIVSSSNYQAYNIIQNWQHGFGVNPYKFTLLIKGSSSSGKTYLTKIWQNLSWIRFHKNTDSVDKHRNKFEDKYEMLKLVENYVNNEYHNFNNQRYFCYVDIEDEKIKGVDKKRFESIVEQYIGENYKKLITPMLQKRDLGKGSKVHTPESAVKYQKQRIISYYLD